MEAAMGAEMPILYPINLLTVDLMFTILVLRGNSRNRKKMLCAIYRAYGQLPDSITDTQIMKTVSKMRRRFAAIKTDEAHWEIVNQFALRELRELAGLSTTYVSQWGRDAHIDILSNPEHYAIQSSMIKHLRWLRRNGVRVVVVSNQKQEYALKLIKKFGIENAFDRVYTSEELGVRKPFPGIWEEVILRESEKFKDGLDVNNVVHLGNSANSDVGAAALGIRVLLYDRYHELDGLLERDFTNLDIPDQDAEELFHLVNTGLLSVHNGVPSFRAWIKQRVARRKT